MLKETTNDDYFELFDILNPFFIRILQFQFTILGMLKRF